MEIVLIIGISILVLMLLMSSSKFRIEGFAVNPTVKCESHGFANKTCNVPNGPYDDITIKTQHSNTNCVKNANYELISGGNAVEVKSGCRATFNLIKNVPVITTPSITTPSITTPSITTPSITTQAPVIPTRSVGPTPEPTEDPWKKVYEIYMASKQRQQEDVSDINERVKEFQGMLDNALDKSSEATSETCAPDSVENRCNSYNLRPFSLVPSHTNDFEKICDQEKGSCTISFKYKKNLDLAENLNDQSGESLATYFDRLRNYNIAVVNKELASRSNA